MYRKLSFTITLSFWASLVLAQTSYTTLGDSVQLRINSNGSIGIDLNNLSPSSSATSNANNHFLQQAGLYIVAQDENGQYHSATQYLQGIDSFDFWPGPVDTLTLQTGNIEDWDKVWSVTKEEVDNHIANWNTNGYVPIVSIANWPANGTGSYAKYLAPFVDYNNDGIYNPELGDYPAIRGKKSAYCIFNDLAEEHTASLGVELGIEVQLLAYQLENSNSIYLEYYIINRSITKYDNVWAGFVLDGQCGNPNDNFAGTFASYPQSIFVYNADDSDEGYFGKNLPYTSATFLNENMAKSIAFDGNKIGTNGTPKTVNEFIEIGQGNWKNGQQLQQGGDGISTTSSANYIFSQDPQLQNPWIEKESTNDKGKRTILGIAEYTNYNSKDFIKMDVALNFGTYTSEENRIDNILKICEESMSNYRKVTHTNERAISKNFSVYPNPSNSGQFTIESDNFYNLEILNKQGVNLNISQKIKKGKNTCNISLPTGVYYLKLITEQGVQTIKLCITN